MIAIVDYGMGNLRSVEKAIARTGTAVLVTSDARQILDADGVVLPGVGAFGACMENLASRELVEPVCAAVRSGKPFLGICLGLQALFTSSEEAPGERGLGIYPGEVRRFQGDVRIPHMGWNQLEPRRETRLLQKAGKKPFVYFAHSYYCPVVAQTAATCDYTVPYTAVLENQNVYGVQFHPEKSGAIGLQIVRNFVEC